MKKQKNDFVGEPEEVEFVNSDNQEEEVVHEEPNQNGSKKKKSTFKAKVSVVRGIVYEYPDALSKGVAATSRGNQIKVLDTFEDVNGDGWYNVSVPRRGEDVFGWIQKSKVVRI